MHGEAKSAGHRGGILAVVVVAVVAVMFIVVAINTSISSVEWRSDT